MPPENAPANATARPATSAAPATPRRQERVRVDSVIPCLTFRERGEEAVRFYVDTFRDSRIIDLAHGPPGPDGQPTLLHASFELRDREFTAMDGGPAFSFSQGFSMQVTCETQEEIDALWERLAEGGEPGRCGWVTDRYGVSWQVVPRVLGDMMRRPDRGDAAAVVQAFLKMGKFDIAALERAYAGGSGPAARKP